MKLGMNITPPKCMSTIYFISACNQPVCNCIPILLLINGLMNTLPIDGYTITNRILVIVGPFSMQYVSYKKYAISSSRPLVREGATK
jgi:hypothetical protein